MATEFGAGGATEAGDDDTGYEYGAVDVPSDDEDEQEETLDNALRNIQLQKEREAPPQVKPVISRQPEVIDDFIRNFLVKAGLRRTLEAFEAEWYERSISGGPKSGNLDSTLVPDLYLQNVRLEEQAETLRTELLKTKELAENTKTAWEKLKKEKNYHKMSHNRVVQEKDRLIKEVKRLQAQCAKYDPIVEEMRHKYEASMKEKMLLRLDRDKLLVRLTTLENTVKELEAGKQDSQPTAKKEVAIKKVQLDSPWPSDDRPNPFANGFKDSANPTLWTAKQFYKGHAMSIPNIALHSKLPMCGTVSDDRCWKIWNVNNGELVMSSDQHRDWVAGVDFNPRGTQLATGSGDHTVKVWDFHKAECLATFKEHTQGVWCVAYHDSGSFLASCSMDHTTRIWDLNSMRCRGVLRGHVDSVNAIAFQPFTNALASCSGDKTVSLWDPRTAYCSHTFYGHANACNSLCFTPKADTIISTDADGKVMVWDIRTVRALKTFECGPYPANGVSVDRTSTHVAVASDDASIKLLNLVEDKEGIRLLRGHEDAVLQVRFDLSGGAFLASCGADATWRTWS